TSTPKVEAGTKSTCTLSFAAFTVTSCGSNPTDVNTSVSGSFEVVVSLKLPFSSVNVPVLEPLMVTDTAGTTSLLELFRTLPEIVIDWARAASENTLKNSKAANERKLFLIMVVLVNVCSGKIRIVPIP